MNHNLLKKILISAAITTGLAGCGGGSGVDTVDPASIQPLQVNGNLLIVEDEMTGVLGYDLLQGVTNPSETTIYTRQFTYEKEEEDADGNVVPLFVGPDLPLQGVYKSADSMFVITDLWRDVLVHPETLNRYPNPTPEEIQAAIDAGEPAPQVFYTQGIYQFSYLLDNGSDQVIERKITVTINGAEVKAESIELISAESFDVPKGFGVGIEAMLAPANTTFDRITYTSMTPETASVSADGVVTGVEFGPFTIRLTSEDGSLTLDVSGEVIQLMDPVGVNIIEDEDADPQVVVNSINVPLDTPVDLDLQFLPITDEVDFSETPVTWESSDESKLTVDENGLLTALVYNKDIDQAADNIVIVTATIDGTSLSFSTEAVIVPGDNLLGASNFDFSEPLAADFLYERTAENSPGQVNNAFFELRDDENSIDGQSLYVDMSQAGAGDLRLQFSPQAFAQAGIRPGVAYALTFDIRVMEGSGYTGWFQGPSIGWTNSSVPANIGEVQQFRKEFTADQVTENGMFWFNFHGAGGAKAYIDNMAFTAVE